MKNNKKTFYKACYYLCGLENKNNTIQINDSLKLITNRNIQANKTANFSIDFYREENKIDTTIIDLNFKKAIKYSDFFQNNSFHNRDLAFTILEELAPINFFLTQTKIPNITEEEQNEIIITSQKTIKESLEYTNYKTKSIEKAKKLLLKKQ